MTGNGGTTARHRAAPSALAENDRRLREVIDAMPHMVWLATLAGDCIYLSRRWEEFTGIPIAEQLGYRWTAQLHELDRPRVRSAWEQAIATGSGFRVHCRIRRFDSEYRWFETRGMPLRGKSGNIVNWFGTNTEIHAAHEARRELIAKEERLRFVALATHDAIYDWDVGRGMTYCNERFRALFIEPDGAALGGNWWAERVHPEDYQRVVEHAAAVIASRTPTSSDEYRLRRPDGGYAVVTNRAYLFYSPEGEPLRVVGAISDVTERRQAEQTLRDTRARLVSALQGGGLATWIWDVPNDIVYWDESAYSLWGRRPEDVGQLSMQKVVSFVNAEDTRRATETLAEFYRTGVDTTLEFRNARPDGTVQWLMAKGQMQRDANGQPLRMAGVYIDITERKQREQTLRDSQDRLRSAMEAADLATWIWDLRTDEVVWDDVTCRLWGREPDEFRTLSMADVWAMVHPDDRQVFSIVTPKLRATGREAPIEFRTLRPDGKLQWLLAKGQVQRDASGQLVRMAGVYVDITDRKRTEEAQLQAQKMEALGTLAGGIAHDFNNILLAITGNAKLALSELEGAPSEQPVQRNLREIDKAASRAAELVKRILTFSRQQETRREVLRLPQLIEEALRLLRPTLPANLDIRMNLEAGAAPVAGEAIQFQQVLVNLVTNAAHAIGEKAGVIEVRLGNCELLDTTALATGELAAGRYVRLTVSDTGVGIDPAVVERMFEPFYTTKKTGEGTGLGLAVVHGIVQAQGGAIGVESRSGGGTNVVAYFPVASGEPSKEEIRLAPVPNTRVEHVLYVDDEESLVFLIARVLERLGYRVTGFVDPEEALRELRANPDAYDVVVTDLSMRGMNGFELTRAVKSLRSNLPVLLTSGYLRSEDREAAAEVGIRELILKPNTVEELGRAIDRTLAEIRR